MNQVITTPEIEEAIRKNISIIKTMTSRLMKNYSITTDLAIARAEKRLMALGVHFPVAGR